MQAVGQAPHLGSRGGREGREVEGGGVGGREERFRKTCRVLPPMHLTTRHTHARTHAHKPHTSHTQTHTQAHPDCCQAGAP